MQFANVQSPALLRTYLEIAEHIGKALITGHVDTFKDSMQSSIATLEAEYLGDMLNRSKTIQRYLV